MRTKFFLSLLVGAVALAGLGLSISAATKKQAPRPKAITAAPQSAVATQGVASKTTKEKVDKIVKTDAEWKELLSESQYRILRKKGTEVAFTGKYWNNEADGTYLCAACGLELFDSDTKFKSGTGWPSFYKPAADGHVGELRDVSFGMARTEIVCNRCGGHLGHVFNDGPQPTGLRYCVNSASLEFKAKDEAKVKTATAASKTEEK